MKSIKFLQLFSFGSRLSAMLVGIFQSLLIVNILTTSEFGLIGLVVSIAGVAGIAQHLGLASSSTKEISGAKNDTEVFHIALTSVSIRYLISLPISLGLIFLAPFIAEYYQNIDLITPLRIFGLVLLVQAMQSIFNSIIAGKQEFKKLFTYQILISFVSLFVFIPLVFFYGVLGYFYALLVFNIIQTLALGIISLKGLNFKLSLPTKSEYKRMFVELLSISLAIYGVKIIFTAWQELPVLILGQKYPLESIGIFAFAFNFASKLMTISDSITDVNLPVFSKKALESTKEFFNDFNENFNFLYSVIFLVGSSIIFWSREILILSDEFIFLVTSLAGFDFGKNIYEKYSPSVYLFFPLIISIIFYSFLNILKSSIYVPLSRLKKMINSYLVLFFVTFGSFYMLYYLNTDLDGLILMSWSLAFGALLSFLYCFMDILRHFKEQIINSKNLSFTLLALSVSSFSLFELTFLTKISYFMVYLLVVNFVFNLNFLSIIKRKIKK